MLLTGFDSLYSKKKDIDFNDLETRYGIKFPSSYKLFANSFKLGVDSLRKEYYLDSKKELKSPLLSYSFGEGKTFVSVEDFIEIPEVIELRKSDADQFRDENLGLMRIAFTNDEGGGGVYMGMVKNNFGRIYKASWDFLSKDGPIEIAETIFDFTKGLKSSLMIFNGIDANKLYKNWNEEFWRIRE